MADARTIEHEVADELAARAALLGDEPTRAKVLLGGSWFEIQYPADVPSLSARVYAAQSSIDRQPLALHVMWGWGRGALPGLLFLSHVEGVVDNDSIEGERERRATAVGATA